MVEKLLTNWLSICLYAFLRVRGTVPLPPALSGRLLPSRHVGAAACALPDQGPARGGFGKGRTLNPLPGWRRGRGEKGCHRSPHVADAGSSWQCRRWPVSHCTCSSGPSSTKWTKAPWTP